jgi:putative membrane protein
MKRLLSHLVSAGVGLWLATVFIVGVTVQTFPASSFLGISIDQPWKFFILFAVILGLLNFFVKPILNVITLPLRIITLGLFGFIINMGLIWLVDYMFLELKAPWFYPLFWTTLIIWLLHFILSRTILKEDISTR